MTKNQDQITIRSKSEGMMIFCNELPLLLAQGITLEDALQRLQDSIKGPAHVLISSILDNYRSSGSIAKAMLPYPDFFDEDFMALLSHAELRNIDISDALRHVFQDNRKIQSATLILVKSFKRHLRAMNYPLFIFWFSLLILTIYVYYSLPGFREMFGSFDRSDLPPLTQMMLQSDMKQSLYVLFCMATSWSVLASLQAMPSVILAQYLTKLGRVRKLLSISSIIFPFFKKAVRWFLAYRVLVYWKCLMNMGMSPAQSARALISIAGRKPTQASMGNSIKELLFLAKLDKSRRRQLFLSERIGTLSSNRISDYSTDLIKNIEAYESQGLRVFSIALLIIIALWVLIILIAMYLPIFKLGATI